MNRVEISWENLEKPKFLKELKIFIKSVLSHLGKSNWSLSVRLCDNPAIRDLNRTYRGMDEPTDILSFSQTEGEAVPKRGIHYAGDLVISPEKVKENSGTFNVPLEEEFKRVLIHGILHLDGMDHSGNEMTEEMLKTQERILKELKGVKIF